ncbi:MAG: glycosyltransferase family 2 protein [Chromatiaceae bacterium]|nr:glycosyltransferase family 2 protein [Chromatiaceae bacterium]
MVSIIVPTLWADPTFPSRVTDIAQCALVKEILVIDNNPHEAPDLQHDKIEILKQRRNIYVNPAWNLGAKKSSGEFICFLNDDLAFKTEIIKFAVDLFRMNPAIGLIGLDWPHPTGDLHWGLHGVLQSGFGCMIFIRRADFFAIPSGLKIWYGDNFMFELAVRRGKKVAAISGFTDRWQEHSISTNKIFKNIKEVVKRDETYWNRYIRRLLRLRYDPQGFFSSVMQRALRIWRGFIGV